ncbi:MAG: hypothetical protein HWE10_07130 [Gammaproteobacteria bacterium]|nr:hypothetical protein [Gammaproteobacteria bacterium]
MEDLDTSPASINDLESLVFQKDYVEAEALLVRLIRLYGKDKIALTLAPFDRKLTQEQSDLESYQVIEKLAFVLTAWFSSLSYSPSPQFYSYITMQKNFIGNIFAASSYHSTDHIVDNLGLLGKANYTPEEIRRILFVFTIESDIDLPWPALLQHLPNETAQAFTGLISSIGIQLSKRAQKNISVLLDTVQILPTIQTDNIKNLGPLIKAYFNCSNLANPNKYELKKWIVRTLEESVLKCISPGVQKRVQKSLEGVEPDKDIKVLFIHEAYSSGHAMYRCWHSMFELVKNKFHTVGLSLSKASDTKARQDFHEFHTFDDEWSIEPMIKTITKIQPTIVVYPSIGMSAHAPLLAAMRLAPIQVACPGHPSSSYMTNMDYFFMSRESLTDQEMESILSESWLECGDGAGQMVLLDTSINQQETDEVYFDIAINGVIQKVSNQLIDMCNRISKSVSKSVRFHMFMASPKQDLEYYSAKSMLRRFLPNSIIHPFSNYSTYLSTLTQCHFALPTIPFGGSNSNIDLIRVGIPKLFIQDKNDLSGLTDLQLWQAVGETYGYCDSVEELESRAIELINDADLLSSFKMKIKEIDLYSLPIFSDSDLLDNRLVDSLTSALEQYQ